MDDEVEIVIDYGKYKPADYGYIPTADTTFEIKRGLGIVSHRVRLVTLDQSHRLDEVFPWESVAGDSISHANPIIASVYARSKRPMVSNHIFAIRSPRSHSKGFMVACIRPDQDFAHDAYLPSWVSGIPDPGCKFESNGFPPGVHFLVFK